MAPFPHIHGLEDLIDTAVIHPTRTVPTILHHLIQRQTQSSTAATVTVITGSDNNDNAPADPGDASTLSGGAIAGIVIGSIAGFLLLVWIIRSCTNIGAPPGSEARPGKPWYGGIRDEYPPRHASRGRSRSRSRSRSRHSHHSAHHHHHHSGHGRRSRRVSVAEAVPVTQVAPAVVREERSPGRAYYGRSRSRTRY
ncbi:hypothetical protein VTK56DRAFT_5834 [Thermocarpiscus australiensis]